MGRVRVGSLYVYVPVMLDIIDGRTELENGDVVKVINMPGCTLANTMGHCYVNVVKSRYLAPGQFAGLVCCNSLVPLVPLKEWKQDRAREDYKAEVGKGLLRAAVEEGKKQFEDWRTRAVCKAIDKAQNLRWYHGGNNLTSAVEECNLNSKKRLT
jgi:hypothetical protein